MSVEFIRNLTIGSPRDPQAQPESAVGKMGARDVRQLNADGFSDIISKIIEFVLKLFGLNEDQGASESDSESVNLSPPPGRKPEPLTEAELVQAADYNRAAEIETGQPIIKKIVTILKGMGKNELLPEEFWVNLSKLQILNEEYVTKYKHLFFKNKCNYTKINVETLRFFEKLVAPKQVQPIDPGVRGDPFVFQLF